MACLNQSLTSHWSCEETVGSTFADDVGTNPLTVSGVTLGAAGIIGNCGSYDRVNDNAKIAHATQVGLDITTGSFTLRVWFKTSVIDGATQFYAGKTINTGATGGYVIQSGGPPFTVQASITDGTTAKNVPSLSALLADSAWHMATMVVDRGAQLMYLYIDGVSQGSVDITAVGSLSSTQPFALGSSGNDAGFYKDFLDQVAFWNGRVLNATEISDDYNAGAGRTYAALATTSCGAARNSWRMRRRCKP